MVDFLLLLLVITIAFWFAGDFIPDYLPAKKIWRSGVVLIAAVVLVAYFYPKKEEDKKPSAYEIINKVDS